MEILLETYNRLLKQLPSLYQRTFYDQFSMDQRFDGIVGARGVGKTTFLLHYLKQNYANSPEALYISADHLYLGVLTKDR